MGLMDFDERCLDAAENGVPRDAPRVQMFRRASVDRWLTQTHPAAPYVIFAPLCAWLVWRAHHDGVGALTMAGLVAGGWLAWTLVEYVMHRYGLHLPTRTRGQRVAFYLVHGHHHEAPNDSRRLVATPIQSILLALLLSGIARLCAGPVASGPLLAGMLIGYQLYELAHWSAHHARTRMWPIGWLRRHHLSHHHEDATVRFGISTPIWDFVFRTAKPKA